MTVRAQYDMRDRWMGNQRGNRMISTGMVGTCAHESCPNWASRMRVKTLACSAPPCARIALRAFAMWGASGLSPIIFRQK